MTSLRCPEGLAERLDRALARLLPGMSRGEARRLIAAGSVFVDGRRCRVASRVVRGGAEIRVEKTPVALARPLLAVIYDDAACLAVDKPAGMPSAPTRVAAAGSALEDLRGAHGNLWLVHRLDRGTSGVLLFARTRRAAQHLGAAFRDRVVEKFYLAWIAGSPVEDEGVVSASILAAGLRAAVDERGQEAETRWAVVERHAHRTLVRLAPRTGRMHQLRVHMASIGHPILGDPAYGGPPASRLMLHAERLRVPHPGDGRTLEIVAAPGPEFGAAASSEKSLTPRRDGAT